MEIIFHQLFTTCYLIWFSFQDKNKLQYSQTVYLFTDLLYFICYSTGDTEKILECENQILEKQRYGVLSPSLTPTSTSTTAAALV